MMNMEQYRLRTFSDELKEKFRRKRCHYLKTDEIMNKKLPELENKPGVYFLWLNNKIVYVGSSKNLSRRILSSCLEQQSDLYSYVICSRREIRFLEYYYIAKIQPVFNTDGKYDGEFSWQIDEPSMSKVYQI